MMTPYQDELKAGAQPEARSSAADTGAILLCVALFLLAAAATNPSLEMGVNDDWSYAHAAREFAFTGRIAYDGWATPMLLPQIVWAAVFIKLFGFSFFVVRLSTIVLGAFLIPVLYSLGRVSGLAPPFAVFATLLTALSPLVMPEAVSFMSDVPAFFLFALCLYGGVQSWKASTPRACMMWAGLTGMAGVLSGLDRQIYFVAPLLFLPVVAWIHRRKQSVMIAMGVVWLLTAAVMVYFLLWFQAKPYSVAVPVLDTWKHSGFGYLAANTLIVLIEFGLTAGLMLLPLLAGYAAPGLKAGSKPAFLVLTALWAGGLATSMQHNHAFPGMGNILTEYGILPPGIAEIGARPVILGPAIRDALTLAVLLCWSGCGLALWKRRAAAGSRLWQDPVTPLLVLGLVFTVGWLPPLLYRSVAADTFDRYLIPFLPLIAIPLLRYYQVHIGSRVSRLSWAMLAVFALYGVATTHDAYAAGRARLTAAQTLRQAGIPRTAIMAGYEYDGWTELETTGHLNNRFIENPAGAYRPVKCTGPDTVRVWYLDLTPSIQARYFVVLSRSPELEDGPGAPVSYTAWLPPARRQVFTQMLPEGAYAGCR
jgi:hypothetical protein